MHMRESREGFQKFIVSLKYFSGFIKSLIEEDGWVTTKYVMQISEIPSTFTARVYGWVAWLNVMRVGLVAPQVLPPCELWVE